MMSDDEKGIKIDSVGFIQKGNQVFLQIGLNTSPDEIKTLLPEHMDGECSLSYSLQIIAHKDGQVLREIQSSVNVWGIDSIAHPAQAQLTRQLASLPPTPHFAAVFLGIATTAGPGRGKLASWRGFGLDSGRVSP